MTITPESVQVLLNSEDYGDRLSGLNKLRQLSPDVAFGLIKPLITDSHPRVRYSAVSQMDSLGGQNLAETLPLLRERLLTDKESDVRAAAADAIAALKLTEAFDDLLLVYQQSGDDWLIQFSIIAALGEMGDPRSFPLLQEALDSDNTLLQTAAIGSFGELGDPRAIALLAPFVTHSDWQIRHRLVQALTRLGTPESHALLAQLTQDEFPQIAQDAQAALD
ncbi:phycobilisome degradation protein NblB [Spirulina subsalsa]|uniref:phycobilisome degradation protein NblB n=1 Tax=Spirulina subsalsa TaxID=54311 RepID=UPI000315956C|nr:HEAT repeat domain-containing protein [Spirulina subsalsa]